MIILNETVKVDHQVLDSWQEWVEQIHIPAMMDTGIFSSYKLCRLLGMNETDGVTFALQFVAADMKSLHTYQVQYAPQFSSDMTQRFGELALAFRTILRVLEEGIKN